MYLLTQPPYPLSRATDARLDTSGIRARASCAARCTSSRSARRGSSVEHSANSKSQNPTMMAISFFRRWITSSSRIDGFSAMAHPFVRRSAAGCPSGIYIGTPPVCVGGLGSRLAGGFNFRANDHFEHFSPSFTAIRVCRSGADPIDNTVEDRRGVTGRPSGGRE
jgi:hypothetical protein